MAGHSHSANIRHRKAAVDAKKGVIFSRHAKLIMSAARLGGADPSMNARLTLAIDKARAANMPKDKIERAIKKGTGQLEGLTLEEARYEAYGPGGVALIIDCITDNKNRTAPEMRQLLEKNGGRLAETGSVAWMFDTHALVALKAEGLDEDQLTEQIMELGADDLRREGDEFEVLGDPTQLNTLHKGLLEAGHTVERAEITMTPKTVVELNFENAEQILKLLDACEAHDDVQNTFSNLEIPDDVMARLSED